MEILRTKDVARLAGVCPFTLRRWLKKGAGPTYRKTPSGIFLFEKSVVEKWLRDMEIQPRIGKVAE